MIKVLAIACVTVPAIVVSAIAQQPAIKRTVLRSIDYPAGYTTVTAIVEVAPGACSGRHTHPGIDSGYVLQGDFVLKVEGKPEQTFKAGDFIRDVAPDAPRRVLGIGYQADRHLCHREGQAAGIAGALIRRRTKCSFRSARRLNCKMPAAALPPDNEHESNQPAW